MPVRSGDKAVWPGAFNEIVTVGTISRSGKTAIVKRGDGEEVIVEHKELLTLRQAANRGLDTSERPYGADTAQDIVIEAQDSDQPY